MRVHYFQHVPFEGLGSIAEWLTDKGHVVTATQWWADGRPPSLDDVDWLIVMGGPMGVHDEYRHPWLVAEKRCIEGAIAAGRAVLGICLGAQLIADVLGARVYANGQKEIGWFPVRRTPAAAGHPLGMVFPESEEVFHWHGDTFDLPAGSVHLAASDACRNQAFVLGERVLALQFHLETTRGCADALVRQCRDELVAGPHVQSAADILARPGRFARINDLMRETLDAIAAQAVSR
jgi:GMP synthase (glutamine-hydrolysing)